MGFDLQQSLSKTPLHITDPITIMEVAHTVGHSHSSHSILSVTLTGKEIKFHQSIFIFRELWFNSVPLLFIHQQFTLYSECLLLGGALDFYDKDSLPGTLKESKNHLWGQLYENM